MTLALSSLISSERVIEAPVVYIVSPVLSSHSITALLKAAQQAMGVSYRHLSLSQEGIEQQLAISFLGDFQWYWLGSLDELSAQEQAYWRGYCQQYQGPHKLWCHAKEKATEHDVVLTVPETVDYSEFAELALLFFPHLSRSRCDLFQPIFKERKRMSLDAALLLMQYASVLSVQQIPVFIREWVDQIFVPDHSLFALSTEFFSHNSAAFLSLWATLKNSYSVHFWLSYWSDQIFRAYCYVHAKQNNDMLSAKKYAYRLPFSLIQRDWKKHSVKNLKEAHQQLYTLDFMLKQGGDERFLDLWIYEFCTRP